MWNVEWEWPQPLRPSSRLGDVTHRAERGDDIAERLLRLGAAVVSMAEALPRKGTSQHVALQVIRSATSAGANYYEACQAESRADFIHKLAVSAKELSETLYWLKLIETLRLQPDTTRALARETDEVIAILVASARTARDRA